jgi:hypothetical protein
MKNLSTKLISLLLVSFTIPIESKISIPKLPSSVSSFFSKTQEEIQYKEFNDITKLEVLCDHGNVFIETWKQKCVLVELKKQGSSLFLQDASMKCLEKDSILQVTTSLKQDAVSGTMVLRILVPETLPIKINASQGDISIKGLSGDIDAQTLDNSITIIDGKGSVVAHTDIGNILLQREKINPDSCITLQSEQGNITVAIPQDLHAEIQAKSPHGKIYSDLFVTMRPHTMLLNDEEFKKLRKNVHCSIGQSMENKHETLMLLKSDTGTIKITSYSSKKRKP